MSKVMEIHLKLAEFTQRSQNKKSLLTLKPFISAPNSFPFGMLMPNRHENSDQYRYSFQGQEKDDEIKGQGNSINFTFRMYDSRVGRFFAVDPLVRKFPMLTPYQFAGNRVMDFVELEGLEGADYRFREYMKSKGGIRAESEEYAEEVAAEGAKNVIRYATPLEDIWGVATGYDADGQPYSRIEAGAWLAIGFIPGSKVLKPVIKVAKGGSKFVGRSLKFTSSKHLKSHMKHLDDFGLDNLPIDEALEKYEKKAESFFISDSKDIIRYTREGGAVVQYDKANNIFGVISEDGNIITMFKPDDGLDYFKDNAVLDLGESAANAIDKL